MAKITSDNCGIAAFEAGKSASRYLSTYFLLLFVCSVLTFWFVSRNREPIPETFFFLEIELVTLSLAVLAMFFLYRYYCMNCYERLLTYKLEQNQTEGATPATWYSAYPSISNFHFWMGKIPSFVKICTVTFGPFVKFSGLILLPFLVISMLDWQSLDLLLWCLVVVFGLFWFGTVLMMATEISIAGSASKFVQRLDETASKVRLSERASE